MVRGSFSLGPFVVFIVIAMFFSLTLFYFDNPGNITGAVVSHDASAGIITNISLTADTPASYWDGIYGELIENSSENSTPSITLSGNTMTEFNMTFACLGNEIYTSLSDSLSLGLVVAGDKTDVDDYLGINASDPQSGSSIFSNESSFNVNGTNVTTVPTFYTNVAGSTGNATFDVGLLNESISLVFATHISSDVIGFDNLSHDYQMMLPINQTSTIFYFYSDCSVNVTDVSCGSPTDLTGSLDPDNLSINLTWTEVTNAASYSIYYSTNISAIETINLNDLSTDIKEITGIGATNWKDSNASLDQRRYYKVASINGSCMNLSTSTLGKNTFYYSAPVSGTYGVLASNRISISLNASQDAETFLQDIPPHLNPTISKLDKSDSSGEYLTTHVRGLSDGNNFNLDSVLGYQITVDQAFNHTIIGQIIDPPYVLSYTVPISKIYGILATNWYGSYDFNKTYTAEVFLQEIPANLNPTVSRLDKNDASGEFLTTHVRGLSDGNDFMTDVEIAYAITVDNAYNHTLCVDCFG